MAQPEYFSDIDETFDDDFQASQAPAGRFQDSQTRAESLRSSDSRESSLDAIDESEADDLESEDLESEDPDLPKWYYTEGVVSRRRRSGSSRTPSRALATQPKPKKARHDLLENVTRQESESDGQAETIRDMSDLLHKLYQKVEENEKILKDLQNKHQNSCDVSLESDSSGGSVKSKAKKPTVAISLALRQEVRKVYKSLSDGDNFEGWTLSPGKSINSKENAAVLDKMAKEVKSLNPRYDSADIREAAYRYYKTKCEEESNKRRGLDSGLRAAKRRRERVQRKRKERESAIQKNTKLSPEGKVKWMKVMRNDVMSSEDSDDGSMNTIRPLPWQSELVNTMFGRIDQYSGDTKTAQARRQTKKRILGEPSTRIIPHGLPQWALKKTVSN